MTITRPLLTGDGNGPSHQDWTDCAAKAGWCPLPVAYPSNAGLHIAWDRFQLPRSIQPPRPTMSDSASPLPELPAVGFLSEVSAEHRAFLTGFGSFSRPSGGETFIQAGSSQDRLSLVLRGPLHVVADAGGRVLLLATVGEGDALGEINLFDPAAASASVVARGDCLIWSMTRGEMDALAAADPEAAMSVMRGLLRQLSSRVRRMNEKLAEAEQKASLHDLWSPRKP